MTSLSWLLAIHLLCAVLWVGGVGFLLIVLRPSVAALDPAARLALHDQVFRRFFRLVWHLMPIVLITGYAMLFGVFGGFASVGWPVHVMHMTGLLMSALFVVLFFGPFRALKAASAQRNPIAGAVAMAKIRPMAGAILLLGLVTVVVAAFGP